MGFIIRLIVAIVVTAWLFMNISTASFYALGFVFGVGLWILYIVDLVAAYRNKEKRQKNKDLLNEFLAYKEEKIAKINT